jgi:uncharacterized SAM-binding protein YcdF (DUF218 family)
MTKLPGRRERHRTQRRLWSAAGLAVIGGGIWATGFTWFAETVPRAIDDPETVTDAVVVLTGGSGRLGVGLSLLAQKRAKKLFVSGVYQGVEVAELLRISRQAPQELECCVVLGYSAGDTAGNARETAEWMAKEGYASLRLVTANYHMRRSLIEFRRAMPEIALIPHPVFPPNFKGEEWWRWPGTASLILSEYSKYLVALPGLVLGRRATTPGR